MNFEKTTNQNAIRSIFASLFTIFISSSGFAQCPPPETEIVISTQADVDAFVAEYPDCNEIDGHLLISQSSIDQPITDLTPFSGLQSITGQLWIVELFTADGPTPLDGLHNLTSVGSLRIGYPEIDLENFTPMASLEPLSGISDTLETLFIRGIESTSLGTNFENITTIDDLDIANCPNLDSLPTFPALTHVRRLDYSYLNLTEINIPSTIAVNDVVFPWQDPATFNPVISITQNPNLETVSCVAPLTSCGIMSFMGNPLLDSISGFDALNEITQTLYIWGENPYIFDAFHNVSSVGSADLKYTHPSDTLAPVEITITLGQNQPQLQFLNNNFGLSIELLFDDVSAIHFAANLISASGQVYVDANAATSITGFENLESIGGRLRLSIHEMSQFPDFTSLTSIGGDLDVYNEQGGITDFSGFDNLQHIGGSFVLGSFSSFVPLLESLNGLQNLQSVGDELRLTEASLLADISAITGLQSIGNNLSLIELPQLVTENLVFENLTNAPRLRFRELPVSTLPDFPLVQSLFLFDVQDNPLLLDCDVLPLLESITNLTVSNNAVLNQLPCTQDIQIQNIIVTDNPSLNECANTCLCPVFEAANSLEIENNGEDCSFLADIKDACIAINSENIDPIEDIQIYIDHTNTIHISAENINLAGTLHIYDITGRMVHTHLNTQPEYFALPFPNEASGIYFVSLNTSKGQKTQKIFYTH